MTELRAFLCLCNALSLEHVCFCGAAVVVAVLSDTQPSPVIAVAHRVVAQCLNKAMLQQAGCTDKQHCRSSSKASRKLVHLDGHKVYMLSALLLLKVHACVPEQRSGSSTRTNMCT